MSIKQCHRESPGIRIRTRLSNRLTIGPDHKTRDPGIFHRFESPFPERTRDRTPLIHRNVDRLIGIGGPDDDITQATFHRHGCFIGGDGVRGNFARDIECEDQILRIVLDQFSKEFQVVRLKDTVRFQVQTATRSNPGEQSFQLRFSEVTKLVPHQDHQVVTTIREWLGRKIGGIDGCENRLHMFGFVGHSDTVGRHGNESFKLELLDQLITLW